jgi:gliding motility-associated-like protein
MKWLVILLFLPLFSFGQQVEDYWYYKGGYFGVYESGFYLNSNDSISFFAKGRKGQRHLLRSSNGAILDTTDSMNLLDEFYYEFNENDQLSFFEMENISHYLTINFKTKHLLINESFKHHSKFILKDDTIVVSKYFKNQNSSNLLVITDKDLKHRHHVAIPTYFMLQPIDFLEKDSNFLIFCSSAYSDTKGKWNNISDSFEILEDTAFSYKILEFNHNLTSYRIHDYILNEYQNKHLWFEGYFYPFTYLNTFNIKKHLLSFTWRNIKDRFNRYEIRDFQNNYQSIFIDSFKTNMAILSAENLGKKLFFTANVSNGEQVQLDDSAITEGSKTYRYTVLGCINEQNEVEIIETLDSTWNTFLFKEGENLWIKLAAFDKMVWEGESFSPKKGTFLVHYFRLNKTGKFDAHSVGPHFFHQNNDMDNIMQLKAPTISNEFLYDLNYADYAFYIGDTIIYQNDHSRDNPVWSKSSIRELPIEKPKASFTIDCSNIWLNLKYFDANHYTILVSQDSLIQSLVDGQGYNYALDYLLAPKFYNSKIMYQGYDSLVHLKNLISGKKYYLHIIPGKGQNENSTYNVNTALTLEINLPSSPLQNSLSINPKSDTASCQSDTLFATATSTYPIRWMDGKTESQRFVPETGKYYFTIKDSQGCIVSSDTVTITKHPTPQINRIVASQKPPFCLGDSVWFAANSFELGAHPDSIKYASKVMKTGWYTVKLTNRFDCQSTDSIYVEFGQKPTFKFLQDSVLSFDNKLRVKYRTNADSLLWVYETDTSNDYNNFLVNDSQFLFVNAIDQSGCNIWDSIITQYKSPITEAFPNAFSPNGDGVNDEWYFLHPDTAGTLIIYDRWGGIVHHGPNRWDGKKNGKTLPLGTYRYTFIYEENGVENVKRGLITLIR